jgi:Anti-sigma-28 factor, FlgM
MSEMTHTLGSVSDSELKRRVRAGAYKVDAGQVAEAIMRRGGVDALDVERETLTPPASSAVLVAPELDGRAVRSEQRDALPSVDLP